MKTIIYEPHANKPDTSHIPRQDKVYAGKPNEAPKSLFKITQGLHLAIESKYVLIYWKDENKKD